MNPGDDSRNRFLEVAAQAVDLDRFELLAQNRHSVHRFMPRPVSSELLDRLIACAQWAPNSYNLQPTHFVVVTDQEAKRRLAKLVIGEHEIEECGAVVAFIGDCDAVRRQGDEIIARDIEAGVLTEATASIRRERMSRLRIGHANPAVRALQRAGRSLLRLVGAAGAHEDVRTWLAKQAMASASFFMLAATSAGLGTAALDGFHSRRVRKLLGVPNGFELFLLVAVGHPFEGKTTGRLPVAAFIHRERW
jgi:nitroreductase